MIAGQTSPTRGLRLPLWRSISTAVHTLVAGLMGMVIKLHVSPSRDLKGEGGLVDQDPGDFVPLRDESPC